MYFPVLWNPKIFGANKKNGLKQILIDVDCRSTKYGKAPSPYLVQTFVSRRLFITHTPIPFNWPDLNTINF